MTVSWTAPRLFPDDLLREKEALQPQVRESIEQDAYGYRPIPWYPSLRRRLCRLSEDSNSNNNNNNNSSNSNSDNADNESEQPEEVINGRTPDEWRRIVHDYIATIPAALPFSISNRYTTTYSKKSDGASPVNRASYDHAMQICPDIVARETDVWKFLLCEHFDVQKAAHRLMRYWTMRESIFGLDRAFLPMDLSGDGTLTRDDVASFSRFGTMMLPHDELGRVVIYGQRSAYNGLSNNSADFMVRAMDV
jgi:hypothetical protein